MQSNKEVRSNYTNHDVLRAIDENFGPCPTGRGTVVQSQLRMSGSKKWTSEPCSPQGSGCDELGHSPLPYACV